MDALKSFLPESKGVLPYCMILVSGPPTFDPLQNKMLTTAALHYLDWQLAAVIYHPTLFPTSLQRALHPQPQAPSQDRQL
jgi:hypothetical protein